MSKDNKLATILIAPALLLTLFAFILPLVLTLYRAVEDSEVSTVLPQTASILGHWDGSGNPPARVYEAVVTELQEARQNQTIGLVISRLNFEEVGLRTMLMQAARSQLTAPFETKLRELDTRWTDPGFWRLLKSATGPFTSLYLLRSLDLRVDAEKGLAFVSSEDAVYLTLFARTFYISLIVTIISTFIAYFVAYTMTIVSPKIASVVMFLILVPFWTSILVRTTAWFIILQREGPINSVLLSTGIISHPLEMIFTQFAVYVAMVHVLLPFAILPLYSVMKGIKPDYMRAAASLGAVPWKRFVRIYLPLTAPGIAAGSLMVFMLSVGFYVTPALVGGSKDQMVSFFISFFTSVSINWGMASALAFWLMSVTFGIVVVARYVVPGFRTGGIKI